MAKTLFNHLDAIYQNQALDYFTSLDDVDRKSYSVYMINRLVSMNPHYIEIINLIQQYQFQPNEHYLILSQTLPNRKQWNTYIKKKKTNVVADEALQVVANHYKTSMSEASTYANLMMTQDKEFLVELLTGYGFNASQIKKMGIK